MKHLKVLEGLELLSNTEGYPFLMEVDRINGEWMIKFSAGNNAAIIMRLTTFIQYPDTALDPFCEEMIKRLS